MYGLMFQQHVIRLCTYCSYVQPRKFYICDHPPWKTFFSCLVIEKTSIFLAVKWSERILWIIEDYPSRFLFFLMLFSVALPGGNYLKRLKNFFWKSRQGKRLRVRNRERGKKFKEIELEPEEVCSGCRWGSQKSCAQHGEQWQFLRPKSNSRRNKPACNLTNGKLTWLHG